MLLPYAKISFPTLTMDLVVPDVYVQYFTFNYCYVIVVSLNIVLSKVIRNTSIIVLSSLSNFLASPAKMAKDIHFFF